MNDQEEYETAQAKILVKTEKELGRKLTNNEIRRLLKIPSKKFISHPVYGKIPRSEEDRINPVTGKKLKDEDENL